MSRILVAEDEARLASFLEKGLRASGFTTTVVARRRSSASTVARDEDFDLMILDLGLPGKDGLERAPRPARGGPAAAGDRPHRARRPRTTASPGLETGADDYLAKPFHFEELVARVQARLRGDEQPRRRDRSCASATSRSTCGPAGRASAARRSSSAPASSSSCAPSSSTPTRSSPASSCSRASGATTTTPAPTSSTSTSATCAASSAPSRFETVRGVGYRFRA